MRILYVLPQPPWPPERGGRLVTYNVIEGLRRRHEVSIVTLTHSEQDEEAVAEHRKDFVEIHGFPCHSKWRPASMARSLFSSLPYKAIRFRNPKMAECVARLSQSGAVDLIHAQNFYAAQYVPSARKAKAVQYKENFESKVLRRYAETRNNPLIRRAVRIQADRTKRFELQLCRRFDRNLVISPVDLEEIRECDPSLPLAYSPPSIDAEAFRPTGAESEPDRLVYVGGLDYYPNYDGLLWFHREVLPEIRRRRPKTVLEIVGRGDHPSLTPLKSDPGILFIGRVPDVRPHIRRAALYVVPLRIGGGIKLKVLEAMAMGKAVVTTTVGAEGIEAAPGESLIAADDPGIFATSVVELLERPAKRAKIERRAREVIEAKYGIDVVIPRLEQAYIEVLESPQ